MNSNIKNLIQLYESLIDDFDDIYDDDSIETNICTNYYHNDLLTVLLLEYGISKPKGWKISIVDNRQELSYERESYTTPASVENMKNLLINKGFKLYKSSKFTYCFIHDMDIDTYLNKSKYRFPHDSPFIKELTQKHINWLNNEYPTFPEFIQKMFKEDPTYKQIIVSPDNGIIMIIQDDERTSLETSDIHSSKTKASIFLTGLVIYEEIDENKEKILQEKNKRIDFFKARMNKIKGFTNNRYLRLDIQLNSKHEPVGIIFFNWDDNTNASSKSKKYHVPNIILDLLKYDWYLLNDVEKEDDDAQYELAFNSMQINLYGKCDYKSILKQKYGIDTDKLNFTQFSIYSENSIDSVFVCTLTDYSLYQYKKMFNDKE